MAGPRKKKGSHAFRWSAPLFTIFALFLATSVMARDHIVRDDLGKEKAWRDVLGTDSLLMPGYFGCEHLCQFTMKNLAARAARFKQHPRIVFLSVDAGENWRDAQRVKKQVKGPEAKFWTFITADQETITEITKEIGFSWKKEPASESITHESALYVMKDGHLARKLAGYDLKEKDLDLSAPPGKFFDFKQFCSAFDPHRSKYGAIVMKTVSMSSALFVVFAAGAWLRLRRKKKC